MSIDLSKAKIGDKFINKDGNVFELIKIHSGCEYPYELTDELGCGYAVTNDGSYIIGEGHPLDLVKQVFYDEKDRVIVEMAKSEYEKAKELGVAIQNLPHIVEQPNEDNQELQRRQEVVELARKMLFDDNTYQFYTQFYVRAKQNEGAEQVMTYLQYVMDYAEDCVNKFNQYLKECKL